jgi:hypothetical protein
MFDLGERTAQASLRVFGVDATYSPHEGDPAPVRVILDRDVVPTQPGQQSTTVERRTELTAHHAVLGNAKRREAVTVAGETWLLDRKDRDDGYLVTWFVIPAPPES